MTDDEGSVYYEQGWKAGYAAAEAEVRPAAPDLEALVARIREPHEALEHSHIVTTGAYSDVIYDRPLWGDWLTDCEACQAERDLVAAIRSSTAPGLREAAQALVDADEASRDAANGIGHPGPHDREIHMDPCTNMPGIEHVYDLVGDCAQCGGAQYGTGDARNLALGDLRAALGMERRPWEERYDATPHPALAPDRP